MKASLKVLSGGKVGKELKLPAGKFLVGRGEKVHLRAKSDAISRQHCAFNLADGRITLKDLGSRNGTIVNGSAITEEVPLNAGDKIVIGPLEFELQVDQGLGGGKREAVKNVAEAAERASQRASDSVGDEDIFDWLSEGDDVDREARMVDPDTRQLKLSAEERKALEETNTEAETKEIKKDDNKKKSKKEKKEPGKLPTVPTKQAVSSQEAANETLRKFFNKGG